MARLSKIDQAFTKLKPDFELLDKLHKKEQKEYKEQEEITFAPSYLMKCRRQLYYQKTGVKITNPLIEHDWLKMKMGNIIHELIQNILKEEGYLIECEDFKEIKFIDNIL